MSAATRNNSWGLPEPSSPEPTKRLADKCKVSSEIASIALRRTGHDFDKASAFLSGDVGGVSCREDLLFLPGVAKGAGRLAQAVSSQERVVIYADFDCDGVAAAVLLKEALEMAGHSNQAVYFPSRGVEGYGFHVGSAQKLADDGATLFLTVDCGISGAAACSYLASRGVDVIVTDHHVPAQGIPEAVAVIDPHLPGWAEEGLESYRDLTGTGVAYVFALAFLETLDVSVDPTWAHDLVALSVAADAHPVMGRNREWIRSGLSSMENAPRPGIEALAHVAGIGPKFSFHGDLCFGLVPRLNVAGRLADPRLSFELLASRRPDEASALAARLDKLNQERREVEKKMLEECRGLLSKDGCAMCASSPGWHEGVVGIIASRVRDAHGFPAALAGGEGDLLKGSVRGIPGFNVVRALGRCKGYLEAFGGHEGAGGFTVRKAAVEDFFREFDGATCDMLENASPPEDGAADAVFRLDQVENRTLEELLSLEPFGRGNPLPRVACMDLTVTQMGLMGKTLNHLQMTLAKDGVSRRFISFGQGRNARDIALSSRIDVLFEPLSSVYRGRNQFTPLARSIRPSWDMQGRPFVDLAEGLQEGAATVFYTWSEHAAESLWIALKKQGRIAWLHRQDQTGARAVWSRATLRKGGSVVTTAPWELGLGASLDVGFVQVHRPCFQESEERLRAFLQETRPSPCMLPLREDDGSSWFEWRYPQEDTLRALWNHLTVRYPGRRVSLWDLGGAWNDMLEVAGYVKSQRCFDGGRLLMRSFLRVFEDLGLLLYDESRRAPEMVVTSAPTKLDFGRSHAYLAGEAARAARVAD